MSANIDPTIAPITCAFGVALGVAIFGWAVVEVVHAIWRRLR